MSKKGTWSQALLTFFIPIFFVLTFRWVLFEPFVIPSSSMVPNLLINDHILVLKSSLGLRLPFSDIWLFQWGSPKRGDIMVFKYPENPKVFYIKRLIGLPGDEVQVVDGQVSVNGQKWELTPMEARPGEDSNFLYFNEASENESHRVRFIGPADEEDIQSFNVPEDQFFFMGDNRDQSSDGRVWGFVPRKYLMGHAWVIWLSCEKTLASASYLCDFSTLRPERFFKKAY